MMKKFYSLTKTLLVAALLCVGQNAWADVVGFSATNRITDNGNGTFTTAGNAANEYALAIADLSGITGITGENKFITIEFDTNIPSGSRWLLGIGDKTTRGTTAKDSNKSSYSTDGLVCRFGTSDGTYYRVNGSGNYSLFGVSVHATFTLNKRLGTYSLVLHNNSTDTDVYTASGTSTTVANATIVELYSWVNSSTVTVSDVTVTVKDTYEYSVNAVDGSSNKLKTLKTGSDVSGATIYYAYPRYINVNGTLYKKDKGSGDNHYEGSFTLSSGGDKNVTYAASSYTNVVYFAEGEDVLTLTTNGGNTSRCSMMASGRATSATKIVTLPAGSYNINMAFFAAKTKYFYAYKGSESDANKIFEYEGNGSWNEPDQSAFTLTETTDILVKGGDSNNGIDYICIMKTGDVVKLNAAGYATYSANYDVEVSGAKAYTAVLDFDGKTITCSEITSNKVPAGNGVLLFGDANADVTLSITADAAALATNNLKATTLANGSLAAKGSNNYYALDGDTFKQYTGAAFVHNKAYFEVTAGGDVLARSMSIVFDDNITGVENVEAAAEAKTKEGKFIENGKLVIVKNGQKFNAAGAKLY